MISLPYFKVINFLNALQYQKILENHSVFILFSCWFKMNFDIEFKLITKKNKQKKPVRDYTKGQKNYDFIA